MFPIPIGKLKQKTLKKKCQNLVVAIMFKEFTSFLKISCWVV